MRTQLRNGALAGLAGGAAMAVVLLVAGEGPLQRAIDLEPGGGEELVSRTGQRIGGVLAALLVGVALGLVFIAAVASYRRRQPSPSVLPAAAVAFLTVSLVPFLKYPPNPPGVGESETVGRRTVLYLVLLAWSLMAGWAGGRAWRWLSGRGSPDPVAGPGGVAVAVGLVLFAFAVLPAGPDPDAVPASIVWSFRMAALVGWAAYWAVLGTVLSWLGSEAGGRSGQGRRPTEEVAGRT